MPLKRACTPPQAPSSQLLYVPSALSIEMLAMPARVPTVQDVFVICRVHQLVCTGHSLTWLGPVPTLYLNSVVGGHTFWHNMLSLSWPSLRLGEKEHQVLETTSSSPFCCHITGQLL